MRSDEEIKRDVEDELRWDPNVHADDIAVAVKNGVVTLTGFVTTYAQKFAAERAVKRVAGVVGVANDIEVRLSGVDQRPDPDIARDVVAELKIWLPDLGKISKRSSRTAGSRSRARSSGTTSANTPRMPSAGSRGSRVSAI